MEPGRRKSCFLLWDEEQGWGGPAVNQGFRYHNPEGTGARNRRQSPRAHREGRLSAVTGGNRDGVRGHTKDRQLLNQWGQPTVRMLPLIGDCEND